MRPHENRLTTPCQRGAIAVMTPFLLIVMLSFAALAIDIARLLVVRNELQNAADAAALVGAGGLYPTNPKPNWGNGVTKGTSAITLNATEGIPLVSGQVQAGYWDLGRTKSGLQPQDITPGTNDAAAVQVTISRSPGNNNGSVRMLLAPIFGVLTEPVQATAVAVIAGAGSVRTKGLFPLAINACMYDLYWDKATNQPKLDSNGKPFTIRIDTSYPVPTRTCLSAEWTGFTGPTDTNSIVGLVKQTGADSTISITDKINISSGVKVPGYQALMDQYTLPAIVTVPVVSNVALGMPPSNLPQPVVAFAAFEITAVNINGSHSYLEGSFVANQKITNAGGGVGPYYGAYVPPRLAW